MINDLRDVFLGRGSVSLSAILRLDRSTHGDRGMLTCPVCGHVDVHIAGSERVPYDHGARVVLSFWCQSDHSFTLELVEHKGNVHTRVVVPSAAPALPLPSLDPNRPRYEAHDEGDAYVAFECLRVDYDKALDCLRNATTDEARARWQAELDDVARQSRDIAERWF